jgi:3-oxoacyl-[acyl-carrier-protein] synthase-1/3-oxoacyl-[acyl-carrier-protein] synthase II
MSDACVVAIGAVSALGVGREAYDVAREGEPARSAIRRDPELEAAGLRRPFAARAPASVGAAFADRATGLLASALADAARALDAARPGFRAERVGVAVGTSSGGMLSAERFFAARARLQAGEPPASDDDLAELARRATYFAPLDDALAATGLAPFVARKSHVLAACAASTVALGLALRWLDRGACDVVLAGGYDALSVFVAAGFEALRATTASRSRPFCLERDGMSLGEGAAIVALVREGDTRGAPVLARVAGFGASTDAVHITAPDRTGAGLARAGAAAIADSGLDPARIGLVSAHATATPFNDAMEAQAIASLFPAAAPPIVHPFKAEIGHTLGAAGALEALAASAALAAQVAPAASAAADRDPDAPALLLDRAEPRPLEAALKLSAAFGGANAALVLTRAPSGRAPRRPRAAYVTAFERADVPDLAALAEAAGLARDRLARLDALCRVGLAAVAALAARVGPDALRGAAIVAGHGLATLDTNERFDARRRARGAVAVEPRLFPATSPNAIAGECAIAYGLTGPSFAVSSGLDGGVEALLAGAGLVASRDAERAVVVAADDAGPVARDLLEGAGLGARRLAAGAVAALVEAEPHGLAIPVDPDGAVDPASASIGHLSLLAWLEGMR